MADILTPTQERVTIIVFNPLLISGYTGHFVSAQRVCWKWMLLLCGFLLWKPACEMGLMWPYSYRTPIRLTCCCIWSSETPLGLTTWLETLFLRNWHTGHQEHTCREKHQHSPYTAWLYQVGSPLLADAGLAAIQSQPRASIFWTFHILSLARGCLWLVSIF